MANVFRPVGIPARDLQEVVLPLECLEALRLSDLEKLDQETAAARMNVSRQTFGRVLATPLRTKVTERLCGFCNPDQTFRRAVVEPS